MSNNSNILAINNTEETLLDNTLTNSPTSQDITVGNYSGTITGSNYMVQNGQTLSYPYVQYYQTYSTPVHYNIQLRKLENGWVLLKDDKEYILKSAEDVLKYMKDSK